MTRAGELRHWMTLQRLTDAADAYGDFGGGGSGGRTWADVGEPFPASIRTPAGRELMEMRQVSAEATHVVNTLYESGVTPSDRLKFGTRKFNILSAVNVDECDRDLEIVCKEVV